MKKKVSNIIAVLLIISLLIPNTMAATSNHADNEDRKLLDQLATDSYSIILMRENNWFYAITTTKDGRVEFAAAQENSPLYSQWLTVQDVISNLEADDDYLALLNNSDFVDAVIAYGAQSVYQESATVFEPR